MRREPTLRANQPKHRGLKIIGCICFVSIVLALLLIAQNSPATGYELSIYESLPAEVWICLIAAVAGGTGIVVYEALGAQDSKYWLLGFALLIFGISIILLLPLFKGYFLYGSSDTVAVLRWTDFILSEHGFAGSNRYPIMHILMTQLVQVCGAPPELIIKWVLPFFTLLFILFSHLLASTVMNKKSQVLLSAATTALFFGYYHVAAYPQGASVMILPMVFYLYFRGFGRGSLPFRVCFVIAMLLFPFFHPAPAAVLIACLLAAEGAKLAWGARKRASSTLAKDALGRVTFEPTLISSVTFLTWISSFSMFEATIANVLGWLGGEIRNIPRVQELEYLAQSRGLGIEQQFEIAFRMYGDNLIYLSLAAIALLIIASRFWRGRGDIRNLCVLAMPFLVSGPVWVLIFASTLQVTVGRLLGSNIMMWATPVLGAFALYEMFGRWKRAGVVVVASIIFCTSVVGIFGVYHSPHILQPAWHITRQDVHGAQWFLDHTHFEKKDYFASLGIDPSLALGVVPVPDHFGYPSLLALGQSFPEDVFLVLGERFRRSSAHHILSTQVLSDPRLARPGFDEVDFLRLKSDPSVARLYSNGDLDVLLINGATY